MAKNRIEILNWRSHGDDENYCYLGVYRHHDRATATREVQQQVDPDFDWNQDEDPESQEDYEHVIYVNDHIVIPNGRIIEHNGRKFKVTIREVR